jgi:hypothetical protein
MKDEEKTFRVEAVKGWRVIVGKEKNSGMFQYVVGSKEKAQKVGEKTAEELKSVFKQQNNDDSELIISLEAVTLKKCDTSYCSRLCEADERYCLKCEDDYLEAQMEYAQLKKDGLCEYD